MDPLVYVGFCMFGVALGRLLRVLSDVRQMGRDVASGQPAGAGRTRQQAERSAVHAPLLDQSRDSTPEQALLQPRGATIEHPGRPPVACKAGCSGCPREGSLVGKADEDRLRASPVGQEPGSAGTRPLCAYCLAPKESCDERC
jgi:hypothetical protein